MRRTLRSNLSTRPFWWLLAAVFVCLPPLVLQPSALRPDAEESLVATTGVEAQQSADPERAPGGLNHLDPAKVVTAESCGECHLAAFQVWQTTPHAEGFKTLHRQENAEAIADRLGLRLMKRDSPCLGCHYTPTPKGDQLRAISGVSCESCHGAAADWIDIHNDYGGKAPDGQDYTFETETAEHRQQRIAASRAAGMRRPSDIYATVASCFGCHTVPDERLVNVGRHSLGSADFELVAWSQGDIRHNFLDSFRHGGVAVNAPRPPERLRLLYFAGRALAVEYSLRGLASATESGVFFKSTQKRLRSSLQELRRVQLQTSLPEVDEMLRVAKGVRASLGQRQALLAAADRIGELTREVLDNHDGSQLADLDPLVRGEEIPLPEDQLPAPSSANQLAADQPSSGAATAPGTAAPGTASSNTGTTSGGAPGSSPAPGSSGNATGSQRPAAATGGVAASGQAKTRLRPASAHGVLSASTCQKCHGDQNAWWFNDRHYTSIDPFFDQSPKNVQIARFYGISPSRMTRGTSLCMDCHGTVVTGQESREVNDGVSCQSCHGGAEKFLEPHQEGDKALGRQRPGYLQALQLGMRELKEPATRAQLCTGCHYITDPRLISSGHPSGAGFDYVAGLGKIAHWQVQLEAPAVLQASFDTALAARGAVPDVPRAQLASAAPTGATTSQGATTQATNPASSAAATSAPGPRPGSTAASTTAASTTATSTTATSDDRTRALHAGPPLPRPASQRRGLVSSTLEELSRLDDAQSLGLPPFPEITDDTSVEDLLHILKTRLEQLYAAAGRETSP